MKRKLSIFLTALMTVALVISVLVIPASAATTYTAIGGETTFTKYLVVDADANIPDLTFTYTIAPGTAVAPSATNLEILAGASGATVGSATFSNADSSGAVAGLPTDDPAGSTTDKKYVAKTVTITFPNTSFTKPGVYRYKLSEVAGTAPGVTYDATDRYIDVFVVADSNDVLTINSCNMRTTADNILLTNQYASNPGVKSDGYTNSVTQHDLTFTKAIAGNQGDKNKRFEFTLNISGANPGTYVVTSTDVTGNPTTITVGAGGTATATYSLTNGSSLTVKGLNAGATYTISETPDDYTPSYAVDTDGDGATDDASGTTASYSGSAMSADNTVAFTNTRNGIIPTGIIIAVAPYVIGFCLFGAVVIFMLGRKKRQSAEEN